jgi:outer membrane protein assembly factor BamD (BamD/ComL family)
LYENHPDEALQQLERAKPYDFGTDANLITIYHRSEALLKIGRYQEAVAEFQRLLNARLVNPNSPYLALAQLGVARAASRSGDRRKAQSALDTFRTDWHQADAALPVVRIALGEGLGQ